MPSAPSGPFAPEFFDRRLGSALVFLTAQRCKGNPPPNWKAIAELGGTTAIYMPGGHEGDLANQLIDAGLARETSCFVVASASRPNEQVIETTLGQMPDLPSLPAPAILLIGTVRARDTQTSPAPQNAGKKRTNH